VGLEIHQQLNSERKLFCSCKPELFKDEAEITFLRRLRPTQSELGQIDPAAFFEFQKGVQILYEADKHAACLVEMDEEPPHRLNSDALESALIISLLLNADPVDEIHVMRKTVIDGSTTTGFQRTCVIALAGEIKVGEKAIPIQHVGLEEDAARKMSEDDNILHYRIDRLCIPLVWWESIFAKIRVSVGTVEHMALVVVAEDIIPHLEGLVFQVMARRIGEHSVLDCGAAVVPVRYTYQEQTTNNPHQNSCRFHFAFLPLNNTVVILSSCDSPATGRTFSCSFTM